MTTAVTSIAATRRKVDLGFVITPRVSAVSTTVKYYFTLTGISLRISTRCWYKRFFCIKSRIVTTCRSGPLPKSLLATENCGSPAVAVAGEISQSGGDHYEES